MATITNARNRRVIVTRPEAQAKHFIGLLNEAKFASLALPMMTIEAIHERAHRQAVKNIMAELDQYAILIFVSQNAVTHGFEWIEDFWPQFPVGLECLAIGSKTQAAMNTALLRYSILASDPLGPLTASAMNSEALLDTAALQYVDDKKILILRGVGGRTTLHDVLAERGAKVRHCELYYRQVPDHVDATLAAANIHKDTDVLTVFSGETLENLTGVASRLQGVNLLDVPLVVPSVRVEQRARDLGYRKIYRANNATDSEMLLTLTQL